MLVVAKTRVGGTFCVGGLDANGASVRLYESNGTFPPANTPYDVGQIWEMAYTPNAAPSPPHVEDVAVTSRHLVRNQPNLAAHLRGRVQPWVGDINAIFGGMLQFTGNMRGYIEAPNIPEQSTGFWVPDGDLQQTDHGGKIYYRYSFYELSYVGVAPAIPTIPAGTLVRVSLARWWKPNDADDDFPQRCYLQLSGWYV